MRLGAKITGLTTLLALVAGSTASAKFPTSEPDYTKGETIPFRNNHGIISDSLNCGPIGFMAQCWGTGGRNPTHDSRMLSVWDIHRGSPADGKLQPGDVILGVISPKIPPYRPYGFIPPTKKPPAKEDYIDATKFPYDVRKALAAAITEAEKEENGGRLVLNVWRDGRNGTVDLELPVMGSYSRITPFHCEKSERLITKIADRIVERGPHKESGIAASLDGLGLLATGEEKYIDFLRKWVREYDKFDPTIKELDRRGSGWFLSYELIFLAEYYMATGDEYIRPTLERYAETIALGQSFAGTWTHFMTHPDLNYGRDHGMTASYGSMNTVTGSCAVGLVLARKAGVESEKVNTAIRKALSFLAYFAERGTVPYGDNTPIIGKNDNNGKNSQSAVLFDLAGMPKQARYFSKMAVASDGIREQGHTGHYWSFIWGHIGAARAGDEAAHAFTKNMLWFRELERRHDGDHAVQPQLRTGHWKVQYWSTAGVRLMELCLPRKKIHLTGKGGNSFKPITGQELYDAVDAGVRLPTSEDSVEELFNDLASFSPAIRYKAAEALSEKGGNFTDRLISLLQTAEDPHVRRGAATALGYTTSSHATEVIDALVETLETTDDRVLQFFIVKAFKGDGLRNTSAIAKAVPALFKLVTIDDPEDPWNKLHNEIAITLFANRDALVYPFGAKEPKNMQYVDDELLIAALRSWFTNANGSARGGASKLLANLNEKQLEPLWREIFLMGTLPAPSGVMNHQKSMTNSVKVMARKGFKEGAMLGAIQIRRPGWGEERRVPAIAEILPEFGQYAEPYDQDVILYIQWLLDREKEKAAKRDNVSKWAQRKIDGYEALISTFRRSLPDKDLRSIAPYLKPGDLELAKELVDHYPTKSKPWNR